MLSLDGISPVRLPSSRSLVADEPVPIETTDNSFRFLSPAVIDFPAEKQAKYRDSTLFLVGFAVLLFSVGLLFSFSGLRADHLLQKQTSLLTSQSTARLSNNGNSNTLTPKQPSGTSTSQSSSQPSSLQVSEPSWYNSWRPAN